MKISLLIIFIFCSRLSAQLAEENFDYTTGDLTVVTANWIEFPAGSTDIQVLAGSLNFANYPSSNVGNLIALNGGATGRSGILRSFTAQSGNGSAVYTSFLLRVTSTADMDSSGSGGDYFANLKVSGSNAYRSAVFVKQGSSPEKFQIGLGKLSSSAPLWAGSELDLNSIYLIVIAYIFQSGSDASRLWINPAATGTEPAADIEMLTGSDASNIGEIQFRQQSKSGDMQVDGLRIATSWSQAPLPVELTYFRNTVAGNRVELFWQTATETNNYGFDIERNSRLYDNEWRKIGFVNGYGNSSSPKFYSFADEPVNGKEFQYRLKQIDSDGRFEYSQIVSAVLEGLSIFGLDQNFPNPFNPVTKISYTIPKRSDVKLKVYDLLSCQVAELVNRTHEAGRYQIIFDGSNLPSGVYFYRLEADNYTEVKKFLLVK